MGAERVELPTNGINTLDIARLGFDKRKSDPDQAYPLLTPTILQLILVTGILTSDRVPETFTSSDLTIAKAYLIFVLVFVALTSIIVSARPRSRPSA